MWMTPNPVTVSPGVGVGEARSLFQSKKIRRLPVVRDGRLVGIVTLTDLQKLLFDEPGKIAPERLKDIAVSEIMTPSPITVSSNDPIEKAGLLMYQHGISALPVVDGGALVGIITETDLFKAFVRIMGAQAHGTRITLELESPFKEFQEILDLCLQYGIEILTVVTLHPYNEKKSLVVLRAAGQEMQDFIDKVRESGVRVLAIS